MEKWEIRWDVNSTFGPEANTTNKGMGASTPKDHVSELEASVFQLMSASCQWKSFTVETFLPVGIPKSGLKKRWYMSKLYDIFAYKSYISNEGGVRGITFHQQTSTT